MSELERQSLEQVERNVDIRRQALRLLQMQDSSADASANDTAGKDEAVRALEEAQMQLSKVQQQSAETRDRIGALASLAQGLRARLAEEADALRDIDAQTHAAQQAMTRARVMGDEARAAVMAMLSARSADDAAPPAVAGDDITLADEQ